MSEQSIVRVHEHREFAVISPSDTVNARRYEEIFGNEEAGTAYDLPRTAITRLTTTVVGTFKGLVNYGGPNGG